MSPTLAELRASAAVKPQERVYEVCLAGDVVRRFSELVTEADALQLERAGLLAPVDSDVPSRPKTLATAKPARVTEIDLRLQELDELRMGLREEMGQATGKLLLRARPSGQWRRFVNDHPARTRTTDAGDDELQPRDARITYGYCDSDALIDALGEYVVGWNDELLAPDDWAKTFAPAVFPGDLNKIAGQVVEMHEGALDLPKLLAGSLSTQPNATG